MKNRQFDRIPANLSTGREREMSMQGIWSGTISFSLVAIPVRLVKKVEPGHVSFRMLHNKDHSPLSRRMYCPEEGKIVPPDEIVRGYEIEPNKYILITDEELESVSPERSHTIEVVDFIDIGDIDSTFYDHPYYLVPLKGGEKPYQLLVEVMRRTNKAGLARFVLGEREHFVVVMSTEGALSLMTLHYKEEILPSEDLAPKERKVDSVEKDCMKKIIIEMTSHFNPDKYADERRQKILDLLKRKQKEKVLVKAPEVEEEAEKIPVDLIAVLEESMRKVKEKR